MTKFCECPLGAEINDIPLNECIEDFGQIQKIIFQRIFSTGTTKNEFPETGIGEPRLIASWTPLLAAADSTKVVQSPFISSPASESGAKREYGGGNATLGGIPIVIGREPSTFVAEILQSKQDTIEAMKDYMCDNVGVYFVDSYGKMAGLTDDVTTPTKVYPIPIKALYVGDKKFGGLEEPDKNAIEFYLEPNWSDKFFVFIPTDFNALYDLVTP